MRVKFSPSAFATPLLIFISACSTAPGSDTPASNSAAHATAIDDALRAVFAQHQINTAAIAVIENGEVVWRGYYGEQAPGVPASAETLFDVGSITKTVVAETVLRLVADGKLSLDEPMSAHWIDPDIETNARHQQLTPRMALSHKTGFMNWRFFSDDGELTFINEPGTTYGYSGEGFEYL